MLLPRLIISTFSVSYKVWGRGGSWYLPSPVLSHFFYDKKLDQINLRLEPFRFDALPWPLAPAALGLKEEQLCQETWQGHETHFIEDRQQISFQCYALKWLISSKKTSSPNILSAVNLIYQSLMKLVWDLLSNHPQKSMSWRLSSLCRVFLGDLNCKLCITGTFCESGN